MYNEAAMSKEFRDAMKTYCPRVSCNQIENRVEDSGTDYILMQAARGAMVELKINKTRKPGLIKIKIRPGQRNRLKKEWKLGNPAYMLIQTGGVALLIAGRHVDAFPAHGSLDWDTAEDLAALKMYWPQGSGPGRLIRGLSDFLFG